MNNTPGLGGSFVELLAEGLNPVAALWYRFLDFLPQVVAAVIIVLVGWGIASIVGGIARRVVHYTGVDAWVERTGINKRLRIDADSRYALLSGMVGSLVKWLIILAVIGVAATAINLPQIVEFISAIFSYIPNVLAAVAIFALGTVGAQYASDFVLVGIDVSHLPVSNRYALASIVKYSIIVFTIMAALMQLMIVPNLIMILFGGMVLALALAFGLGGRDHASDAIRKLREQA